MSKIVVHDKTNLKSKNKHDNFKSQVTNKHYLSNKNNNLKLLTTSWRTKIPYMNDDYDM